MLQCTMIQSAHIWRETGDCGNKMETKRLTNGFIMGIMALTVRFINETEYGLIRRSSYDHRGNETEKKAERV